MSKCRARSLRARTSLPGAAGVLLVATALLLLGCKDREADRSYRVAAAASLQRLAEGLAADAEQAGHRVEITSGSSAALARSIEAGAPVDLFLSADPVWTERLVEAGLARDEDRIVLGYGNIAVARPMGEAGADVTTSNWMFAERIGIADPDTTPLGGYTAEALSGFADGEAILARAVRAGDARATLALVERGEVDAGIVYAADANASDRVELLDTLPLPPDQSVTYEAVTLTHEGDGIDWLRAQLTGAEARRRIEAVGLTSPPAGR